jgi:hypothetical protein
LAREKKIEGGIMGLLDSLLGKSSANASRTAAAGVANAQTAGAADTFAKQQAATGALRGVGDQYATDFGNLSHSFDPYTGLGSTGVSQLQALLADPSSIRSTPGYDFTMGEGVKALDRSAAARGRLNSGAQEKDLIRFGQGTADQTYGNTFNRLLQLVQGGQAATGAQVGTQATGLTGQLGANTTAYGGDMTSAPTIGQGGVNAATATGQGEIAAEQAKQTALQNLLGTASYLGGSFLGGRFGPGAKA